MKIGIICDYLIGTRTLFSDESEAFFDYLIKEHDDEVFALLYRPDEIEQGFSKAVNVRTGKLEQTALDFDSVYFGLAGKEFGGLGIFAGISDDFDGFREYVQKLERQSSEHTKFINPPATIQDNISKAYLLNFNQTPIIPTQKVDSLDDLLYLQQNEPNTLVKPLISERAKGVLVLKNATQEEIFSHANSYLNSHNPQQGLIAQPFTDCFVRYGERKIPIIDGEITLPRIHIRESSPDGGFNRDFDFYSVDITSQERNVAMKAYEEIGQRNTRYFARVDLTGPRDAPVVSEIELINPHFITNNRLLGGRFKQIFSREKVSQHFDSLYRAMR